MALSKVVVCTESEYRAMLTSDGYTKDSVNYKINSSTLALTIGSTTYNKGDYSISIADDKLALTNVDNNFTADQSLYSSSGDSPRLIFQRGTTTDSLTDWSIYDTGGVLASCYRFNNDGDNTWHTAYESDNGDYHKFIGTVSSPLRAQTNTANCWIQLQNSSKVGFYGVDYNAKPIYSDNVSDFPIALQNADNAFSVQQQFKSTNSGAPIVLNHQVSSYHNCELPFKENDNNLGYILANNSDKRMHWVEGNGSTGWGSEYILAYTSEVTAGDNKNLYHLGAYDTVDTSNSNYDLITRQTGYYIFKGNETVTFRNTGSSATRVVLSDILNPNAYGDSTDCKCTNGYVGSSNAISGGAGYIFADNYNLYVSVPLVDGNANDFWKAFRTGDCIQYKTPQTYTEKVIKNQPLNTLDLQGSQWLRSEWEKGQNLLKEFSTETYYCTANRNGNVVDVTVQSASDPFIQMRNFYTVQPYETICINSNATHDIEGMFILYDGSVVGNTDKKYIVYTNSTSSAQTIQLNVDFIPNSAHSLTMSFMVTKGSTPYPYQPYYGNIARTGVDNNFSSTQTISISGNTPLNLYSNQYGNCCIGFNYNGSLLAQLVCGSDGRFQDYRGGANHTFATTDEIKHLYLHVIEFRWLGGTNPKYVSLQFKSTKATTPYSWNNIVPDDGGDYRFAHDIACGVLKIDDGSSTYISPVVAITGSFIYFNYPNSNYVDFDDLTDTHAPIDLHSVYEI